MWFIFVHFMGGWCLIFFTESGFLEVCHVESVILQETKMRMFHEN